MHEFSLAQAIVDIALTHAEQHQAGPVRKISVVLGVVSHVAPASLEFSFDLAKQDTPAHQAKLEIRRVPLEASCLDCKKEFLLETSELICPNCGSGLVSLIKDQELKVEYIEVDD